MATLKQRLNRKNSSGTYDTVHLETSSEVVKRPSGETVENDLTNYLPKVQNSDSVPESLKHGQLCTGLNKGFLKLNNSTIQLASQSSIDTLNTEINNLKSSVSSGKVQIASAITDKGVSTAASATFSQMASNIRNINTMPSLLGTWKFNDTLFFPSQANNSTRQNSVTFTFTNAQGTVLTGDILSIGMEHSSANYVIQCHSNNGYNYTLYNSSFRNKWVNEQSKYITFTNITSSVYDVEKYVISILLPHATKIN